MCASALNDDQVVLSLQKLTIVFKRYAVSQSAERVAPVPVIVETLGAKNKMAAFEKLVRDIFEDAGENYPGIEFDGLGELIAAEV